MTIEATFPECEPFKAIELRYQICTFQRLTPEECDRWRVNLGLNPRNAAIQPNRPVREQRPPTEPVGTILKEMIEALKIPEPEGCTCPALHLEMDTLGLDGCRRDRERLIAAMRENASKVKWVAMLQAIGPAIAQGLTFSINPLDPAPGLFDEALRRAEASSVKKKNLPAFLKPKGCCKSQRKRMKAAPKKLRRTPFRPSMPPRHPDPLIPLPYTGPITRHLIYHCWPVAGKGVWEWNLDQLLQRIDLFNGRRIMGIVTDHTTDAPEAVMKYLEGHGFEFMTFPNDEKIGEVVSFIPMLSKLVSLNPNEVIFYAHAKGIKHRHPPIGSGGTTVHRWAAAMYELCLDDWPEVEQALIGHGFAGNFMRNFGASNLNYSGTYFWMRSAHIFSRKWQDVRRRYGGVEFWPSNVCYPREQRAVLFGDNAGNLYDEAYWNAEVEPRLAEWRESKKASALPPPAPETLSQPAPLKRHMIFHLFPRAGCDWRSNCMDTFKYRNVFNGRVIVHIATGENCVDSQQVIDWLQQFQPLEIHLVANVPAAGLNTTFRDQVAMIKDETGIVFKAHTKGISHVGERPNRWTFDATGWRRNMANGCLYEIERVEAKFAEGYRTFGAFKTTTDAGARVVNHAEHRWPGWHYPGAFFWFDPTYVPESYFAMEQHHYINEEFPCILGPSETGFCPTPENEDYKIERQLPRKN